MAEQNLGIGGEHQAQGQDFVQGLNEAFTRLGRGIENVTTILGCQGATQIIKPFSGNPKEYRQWIKNIEKYQLMMSVAYDDCKLLANQTASGPVGGFIQRYLSDNPRITWVELKRELAKRFSDVTDKNVAMTLLRQVKQRSDNVQVYAERILSLAEEGFDNINDPQVQLQLIDIFINGLENDQLKMTILRQNPQTLQRAVDIATTEYNLKYRIAVASGKTPPTSIPSFDLSGFAQGARGQNHEPMDIDHARGMRCFKCKGRGHKIRDCRKVQAVELVCYNCGRKGHIAAECRSRRNNNNGERNRGVQKPRLEN